MLTCQSESSNSFTGHVMHFSSPKKTRIMSLTRVIDLDRLINSVVMDYLISEGYPSAAQNFAQEANIQPRVDVESIQERVEIRNAIFGGDIQTAIEKINELNPQVRYIPIHARCMISPFSFINFAMIICFMHHSYTLQGVDEKQTTTSVLSMSNTAIRETASLYLGLFSVADDYLKILDQDSSLHFALLRLQLIELIRSCTSTPNADITPALTFATTHLAPRAPTNPEFLEDLERTMALLIFPPNNLAPPLAALLDPKLRKDVAKRVNEAILSSQGERTKSKLLELVRTRAWAEKKAREAKKDLPERIDLGLDPERNGYDPREDSVMQGNGEAEAATT